MRKSCIWKFLIYSIVLIVSLSMSGCGKDEGLTAPSGSTITINPSAVSWTISDVSSCPSASYNDHIFTITVKDSDGKSMNNVDIAVELSLAANSGSSINQILELYDGDTGQPVTSPYSTMTGDSGTKNMIVRVDLGCEYTATFNVFSGDAYGTATITASEG